jgi:AbiU2
MPRKLTPEQIAKLQSMDFDAYARTLFDETHRGQVHVDILEGLIRVDPFILNQSPMFWQWTIWAHEYVATMYATKLFDLTPDAFPVPKFFLMARMRANEFAPSAEQAMLRAIDAGEKRYTKLRPTIRILARRRNHVYAHISEQLILGTVRKTKLTIKQLRTVLTEASAVLNSLTQLCRNSVTAPYSQQHTCDYERVISLLTEGLCRKADEQDEEYKHYGGGAAPRPQNCAKNRKA